MDFLRGLIPSKKEKKRAVIRENAARGRMGEQEARLSLSLQGYEVERTGRGSDFRARKRDLFTGRVTESKLVEVKTGPTAKLSKLQKKTKKKKSNYKVMRVQRWF